MKSPTIRTLWFGPVGTCRTLGMHRWQGLLVGIFLAGVTIPIAVADTPTDRLFLPIEVLGADGTVESRRFTLQPGQAESVKSLWLQVHGVRYAEQASVQVNTSRWIPLDNNTVTVAAPGSTFGGIGGGFATLVLTLRLPTIRSACSARGCDCANQFWFAPGMVRFTDARFIYVRRISTRGRSNSLEMGRRASPAAEAATGIGRPRAQRYWNYARAS